MKKISVILTLLLLVACCGQKRQATDDKKTELPYQEIGEHSISLGKNNRIMSYKATADGNYLLYVRTEQQEDINLYKYVSYFLEISPKGDSINSFPMTFENNLTDYIELDDCYYVVTTDLRTMGGYTKDILSKYDKDWEPLWSKKINTPKLPDGVTVLTLTKNNEILVMPMSLFLQASHSKMEFHLSNMTSKES